MARGNTNRKTRETAKILQLQVNEFEARRTGPQTKKKFTFHDLKHVTPMNEKQADVFKAWANGCKGLHLTGWPGTGKTFLGLYAILVEFLQNRDIYDQIIIIRSVVPVRDIGFLPGTEEEKIAVYESPYIDLFNEFFPWMKSYENMKEQDLVKFMPTSFIRGKTFNNSLILVDELQNLNEDELYAVMSRVGTDSRIVLCGDEWQPDLKREKGCFKAAREIVKMMPSMDMVDFDKPEYIVRSGFVREFIEARMAQMS